MVDVCTQANSWTILSCNSLTSICAFWVSTRLSYSGDRTEPHGNRSLRYKVVSIWVFSIRTQEVKLHKKTSFTLSIVCAWTRKVFWVNIFRSLSQVRRTMYTSTENTCIETTGNQPNFYKRDDCISKVVLTLTFLHVTFCFCVVHFPAEKCCRPW